MEERIRIEVLFQGKAVQQLKLREVNESGCILNLSVIMKGGPEVMSVRGECSDDWIILIPEKFKLRRNEYTYITLRVESERWENSGDFHGKIHFFDCLDDHAVEVLCIDVMIHFKKLRPADSISGTFVPDKSLFKIENHRSDLISQSASEFCCRRCGISLPDRRPYCSSCRKQKALEEENRSIVLKEKYRFSPRHIRRGSGVIAKGNNKDILIWVGTATMLCIVLISMVYITLKTQSGGKYRGFGALNIATEPPGALIIFDKNEVPMSKSPLKITCMKAGVYKIHLRMEDSSIADESHEIEVRPDKENSFAFQLYKVGKLYVQSIPPASMVSIDGIETGKVTPVLLDGIREGMHTVVVGNSEKEYKVNVQGGGYTSVFALLDTTKSGLWVKSIKDTKVYVDGKLIGKTPMDPFILDPGTHNVTLIRSNCVTWTQQLKFFEGEVAELSVDPVSSSTLILDGQKGLSVYVNGKFRGSIPQKIICEPGKMIIIKVVARDGRVWEKEFSLLPGEYRRENVVLAPLVAEVASGYSEYSGGKNDTQARFDFFNFNIGERFSPKEWKVVETLYEDVDNDGRDDMILALRKIRGKRRGEYPLYLKIVKKIGYEYQVISLQVPGREGIGVGELYGLYVYKIDDLGYREIEYVCGDNSGRITSSGAFIIYHEQIERPSWVARMVQ